MVGAGGGFRHLHGRLLSHKVPLLSPTDAASHPEGVERPRLTSDFSFVVLGLEIISERLSEQGGRLPDLDLRSAISTHFSFFYNWIFLINIGTGII